MKRYVLFLALLALVALPACDSFVENVDDDIDSASPSGLEDVSQVPFALNGVLAQWADTHDLTTLAADLLSDQMIFGSNGDATFPTYADLDNGIPALNSNTVDGAFFALGQYRFLADRTAGLIQSLDFESAEEVPISREEALFQSYLHAGIARYYYATYFGLNPREGGGVIDGGEFIPSDAMYDSARVQFDRAAQFVSSEESERVLNSVIARNELYDGDYGEAAAFALEGMVEGDNAFEVLYSISDNNEWWVNAGRGRFQVVAAERFGELITEEPAELARVPLVAITQDASVTEIGAEDAIEFAQDLYPERGTPINFVTWQENALMLAELGLRGEDIGGQSPLDLVNAVRASHSLDPLSSVDLNTIAVERDRELFARGARLVDQRRFSDDILAFHLPDRVEGMRTWTYLPITSEERAANDNLPDTAEN